MNEPITPAPRPCSTPHSAPVSWLKSEQSTEPAEPRASEAPSLPTTSPEFHQSGTLMGSVRHDGWIGENGGASQSGGLAAHDIATVPSTRHDGWTGERMAIFCETLAETAVVAEACDAARMGISGAYAARRRMPVFAAAWDAALSIARERLADTLLARSMEGNVEQIYKDGELVGERHLLDNRLGLAILRRLDRLAETGFALHSNPPLPGEGRGPVQKQKALDPCVRRGAGTFDWSRAVDALRSGDDEGVAKALALVESHEVEEVEDPLNRPPSPEEDRGLDLSDRCWRDGIEDIWMTDFPPPAGFTGYQNRPYEEDDPSESYVRACTEEEAAILEAGEKADRAAIRAEDEELRDAWFAMLRDELSPPFREGEGVGASESERC